MIPVRRDARRLPLSPHAWRWAAIAPAASCGGSITSADRAVPDVAEVVVAPLSATVIVGNTLPLHASVHDASGQTLSGPAIVRSVRDRSIATFSKDGKRERARAMRMELLRAVCLAALIPVTAHAQRAASPDPLLRGAPSVAARATCPALAPVVAADAARRRAARELAQRGQQSAILGDRAAARDLLRQAAALDPANAELTYQLARAEESAGSEADATKAYCRFIALAPDAPEAAESRARLAQLMLADRQADSARAATAFARAVAAYQRGQLDSANVAFTTALSIAPDWAEAYYDRGVVRSSLGRRGDAASDFQQYLRLEPGAANRAELTSRIAGLQEAPLSPTRALALGLVIPGAGQFYTGRPVRGALSLLGTGVALACGMSQRASTEVVQQTATDPFGNPYTYTTSRRITERPCRTPGFTAAGIIALVSAIDAYRFARR